jgi:transcriptional regulator with XRE-family HTH domain
MKQTDYYKKAHELARTAGISMAELCRQAGISGGTVSAWKGNERLPSLRVWDKIEQAAAKAVARKQKSARKTAA